VSIYIDDEETMLHGNVITSGSNFEINHEYTTIQSANILLGYEETTVDISAGLLDINCPTDINKPTKMNNNLTITGSYTLCIDSDQRLKENIAKASINALDLVKHTSVYDFNYINSTDRSIGLIAQELEKALPKPYNEIFIKTHNTKEIEGQLSIAETKLIYIL
jgi:hypothetical protein